MTFQRRRLCEAARERAWPPAAARRRKAKPGTANMPFPIFLYLFMSLKGWEGALPGRRYAKKPRRTPRLFSFRRGRRESRVVKELLKRMHTGPADRSVKSAGRFSPRVQSLSVLRIHPAAPRRLTMSQSPSSFKMGRVVSLSSSATLGAFVSFQAYTGVVSSVRYQAGSIAI